MRAMRQIAYVDWYLCSAAMKCECHIWTHDRDRKVSLAEA
jgi:hypothetical protein